MPLVITKEWFETIKEKWNSDSSNVESLKDSHETILWIVEELPLSKISGELEKSILGSGMVDPAYFQAMKKENRADLIIKIEGGKITEFRPAKQGEEHTGMIRGKYSSFEKVVKGEDLIWLIMDGEIHFRGRLPEFAKRLDGYTRLTITFVSNTELP